MADPSRYKTTDDYVDQVLSDLEGELDLAAVDILCRVGVLAVDDPSELHGMIERLAGKPAPYGEAEGDLDALSENIDTAYFLGIAVGRRLGPAAFRAPQPTVDLSAARVTLQILRNGIRAGKKIPKDAKGALLEMTDRLAQNLRLTDLK